MKVDYIRFTDDNFSYGAIEHELLAYTRDIQVIDCVSSSFRVGSWLLQCLVFVGLLYDIYFICILGISDY